MSCPTCGHTLQTLMTEHANDFGTAFRWYPRCGTLQTERNGHVVNAVPKLVERCREMQKAVWVGSIIFEELRRLGILESINRPEDRGYESVQL